MKISDLKDGMVVEIANGKRYLYSGGSLYNNEFLKVINVFSVVYTEDMTHSTSRESNIMKVFPTAYSMRRDIDREKPIWERPIDWSKVAVDTHILVRYPHGGWISRHFAYYDEAAKRIYFWIDGATSYCVKKDDYSSVEYGKVKLATEEERAEISKNNIEYLKNDISKGE